MAPKKTVLIGAYGTTNFGDDILMVSVLGVLRDFVEDECIYVRTVRTEFDYLRRWYPQVNFFPAGHDVFEDNFELALYGGGTQFYSFAPESPVKSCFFARKLNSLKFYAKKPELLLSKFFPKNRVNYAQQIHSEKTYGVSLGAGPFRNDSAEQQAKSKLAGCDWISVRDSLSKDFCEKAGLQKVSLFADMCYARGLWDSTKSEYSQKIHLKKIGVIIRDWPFMAENPFMAPLHSAVKELESRGLEAEYISLAPRCDMGALAELRRRKIPCFCWDPDEMVISELVEKLGEFDLFISSRAHGIVVGACLGIPSIGVLIEPKLRLIAEGLRDSVSFWDAPFNPKALLDKVTLISEVYEEVVAQTRRYAEICARSAMSGADELRKRLYDVYQVPNSNSDSNCSEKIR